MKSLSLIFGLIAITATAIAQSKTPAIPAELIGTWRLISIDGSTGRGSRPNDKPAGTVTYDSMGHMAIQIRYVATSPQAARSAEQKAAAFDNYTAYFGTFTVNVGEKSIVHHIESSLVPDLTGTDVLRYYEFDAKGRLILGNPTDPNGAVLPRKDTTRFLTWERVK